MKTLLVTLALATWATSATSTATAKDNIDWEPHRPAAASKYAGLWDGYVYGHAQKLSDDSYVACPPNGMPGVFGPMKPGKKCSKIKSNINSGDGLIVHVTFDQLVEMWLPDIDKGDGFSVSELPGPGIFGYGNDFIVLVYRKTKKL